MPRKLIAIAIVLAALYGVVLLFNYWEKVKADTAAAERSSVIAVATGTSPTPQAPAAEVPTESLAGLRPEYEAALKAAYAQGPAGLGAWLKRYGPYTGDPRKAAIELDYASLLTRTNPAEAKKIYAKVKSRTPVDSPLYPRVKRLESVYQ